MKPSHTITHVPIWWMRYTDQSGTVVGKGGWTHAQRAALVVTVSPIAR
jgi:hypothetical protein